MERSKKQNSLYNCHQCGESFTPKRSDAKYCSPICRDRSNYEKRKQAKESNIKKYNLFENEFTNYEDSQVNEEFLDKDSLGGYEDETGIYEYNQVNEGILDKDSLGGYEGKTNIDEDSQVNENFLDKDSLGGYEDKIDIYEDSPVNEEFLDKGSLGGYEGKKEGNGKPYPLHLTIKNTPKTVPSIKKSNHTIKRDKLLQQQAKNKNLTKIGVGALILFIGYNLLKKK